MAKHQVSGAPPPSRHPVPTYKVLRPQKDGPLDVGLCANTVFGLITHYVWSDVSACGSSVCCTQYEPGGCVNHDEPEEWAGWIPVYEFAMHKKCILRLAPREYDVIAKVLGIDLAWQGRRIKIRPVNLGEGRSIQVEEVIHGATADLAPWSIERTICLVMGIDRIPRQTSATDDPSEVPL